MNPYEKQKVESHDINDFARALEADNDLLQSIDAGQSPQAVGQAPRINLDKDNVKKGLGKLVLTLVRLLHELLERQSLRLIDDGGLSDIEIENLGVTLMRQAQEIERLKKEFGLEDEDLNIDLGPLGKLF